MSSNNQPIYSAGAGVTLALAIAAVAAGTIVQPESITVKEQFQYIFAALFLGLSFGHYLGEALVTEGENKKYALLGLFFTLGIMFLAFLLYFQGISIFAGAISGALVSFAACLILSHHTGLIENSESLDKLVSEFANKASIGGISFIIVSFVVKMAFSPELADTVSTIAISAISVIIAFYVIRYRELILKEIEPFLADMNITVGGDQGK